MGRKTQRSKHHRVHKRAKHSMLFRTAVEQRLETQAATCVSNLNDVLKFFVENEDGASALEIVLPKVDATYMDESLLFQAVKAQDARKVEMFLLSGKSFSDSILQKSLLEAINMDNLGVVSCILEFGGETFHPNFIMDNKTYLTPLHLASGQSDIVKVLLENGANPNAEDCNGQSPLHLVADSHVSARWMILHGADPNLRDNRGNTSLHMACHGGHLETVKELRFANPDLADDDEITPLHDACRGGYLSIIRWLIESANADPAPTTSVPPLEYAACYGKLLPKELIELGFDPRQICPESGTIAHSILRFENNDLDENNFRWTFMKELLECDPSLVHSLDRFRNIPLHWAQSPNMVNLLVEQFGADLTFPNHGGRIPLIESIFVENNEGSVQSFLRLMNERNLDIDQPDKIGWCALHHAAFHGKSDYVQLLLQHGADVNKKNKRCRSPLHLVGYSFSGGRRMDSFRDDDVSCALRLPASVWPANGSFVKCVESLLSHGASAVHQDEEGNLPFFLPAVTSRVSETFLIIQQAAAQGLFDSGMRQI